MVNCKGIHRRGLVQRKSSVEVEVELVTICDCNGKYN